MKQPLKKIPASPSIDSFGPAASSADIEELEELRAAKETWIKEKETLMAAFEAEKQKFAAEKQRLLDEINSLQHSKADILEQHTKDAVSFKSKETQFSRMQGDLQAAYKRISELETAASASQAVKQEPREMSPSVDAEASFRELSLGGEGGGSERVGGDRRISRDLSGGNNFNAGSNGTREFRPGHGGNSGSRDFGVGNRGSRDFGVGNGSRDYLGGNGHDYGTRESAVSRALSPDRRDSYRPQAQESWQRAAEVTNQLKARIEAMKARQKMY